MIAVACIFWVLAKGQALCDSMHNECSPRKQAGITVVPHSNTEEEAEVQRIKAGKRKGWALLTCGPTSMHI